MNASRDRSTSKSLSTSRASASRSSGGSSSSSRRAPPSPRPRPNNSRPSSSPSSRSHSKLHKKQTIDLASPIPVADFDGDGTGDGEVETTFESLSRKVAQLEESNSDFALKIEKLVEERFNVTMRTFKLHEASVKELTLNCTSLQIEFKSCLERLGNLETQQVAFEGQMKTVIRNDAPASKKTHAGTSFNGFQSDENVTLNDSVDCTELDNSFIGQGCIMKGVVLTRRDDSSRALSKGDVIDSKTQQITSQTSKTDYEALNEIKFSDVSSAPRSSRTHTSAFETERQIVEKDTDDAPSVPGAGMCNSEKGKSRTVGKDVRQMSLPNADTKSTLPCDVVASIATVKVNPTVESEVHQVLPSLLPSNKDEDTTYEGDFNADSALSAKNSANDSGSEQMVLTYTREIRSHSNTEEEDGVEILNQRGLNAANSTSANGDARILDSEASVHIIEKETHDNAPLKKNEEEEEEDQQQSFVERSFSATPFTPAKVEAQTSKYGEVDPTIEKEAHDLWLELIKGQWPISEVEELVNEAVEDGEYTRLKGDAIIRRVYALNNGDEGYADDSAAIARAKNAASGAVVDKEIAELFNDIQCGDTDLDEVKLLVQESARDGDYSLEEAEQIILGITKKLAMNATSPESRLVEVLSDANATLHETLARALPGEAISSASPPVDDVVESEVNELLNDVQNGDYKLEEISVIVMDGITDGDYTQAQGDAILRRVFASVDTSVKSLPTELVPSVQPETPAAISPPSCRFLETGTTKPVEVSRKISKGNKGLSFLKNESASLWAELRSTNPSAAEVQAEVDGLVEIGEYTKSQGGVIFRLVMGHLEAERIKNTPLPSAADPKIDSRLHGIQPKDEFSSSISPSPESSTPPLPPSSTLNGMEYGPKETATAEQEASSITEVKVKAAEAVLVRIKDGGEADKSQTSTEALRSEEASEEVFPVKAAPEMAAKETATAEQEASPITEAKVKTAAAALVRTKDGEVDRSQTSTEAVRSAVSEEVFPVKAAPKMAAPESKTEGETSSKIEVPQPPSRSQHRRPPPSHGSGKRKSPQRLPKPGRGHIARETSSSVANASITSNVPTTRRVENDEDITAAEATTKSISKAAPLTGTTETLPYGGDLKAASAAQDRQAMRQILAYNKTTRNRAQLEEEVD